MELTKQVRIQLREIAREGYTARFYSEQQFDADFNVFFMSKKMISRFLKTGGMNEKLLINNLVVALNSFGILRTNVIFRAVCDDVQFSVVKAILVFLSSYREDVGADVSEHRIVRDMLKELSIRYCLNHCEP